MQIIPRHFLALALAFCATASQAQGAAIFEGADIALGKQLIEEKKCAACHQAKFGGDGSAVYRPGERITTAGALRGMVEQCNTEMGMGLFPEEVTAIAAVLNQRHYRLH